MSVFKKATFRTESGFFLDFSEYAAKGVRRIVYRHRRFVQCLFEIQHWSFQ